MQARIHANNILAILKDTFSPAERFAIHGRERILVDVYKPKPESTQSTPIFCLRVTFYKSKGESGSDGSYRYDQSKTASSGISTLDSTDVSFPSGYIVQIDSEKTVAIFSTAAEVNSQFFIDIHQERVWQELRSTKKKVYFAPDKSNTNSIRLSHGGLLAKHTKELPDDHNKMLWKKPIVKSCTIDKTSGNITLICSIDKSVKDEGCSIREGSFFLSIKKLRELGKNFDFDYTKLFGLSLDSTSYWDKDSKDLVFVVKISNRIDRRDFPFEQINRESIKHERGIYLVYFGDHVLPRYIGMSDNRNSGVWQRLSDHQVKRWPDEEPSLIRILRFPDFDENGRNPQSIDDFRNGLFNIERRLLTLHQMHSLDLPEFNKIQSPDKIASWVDSLKIDIGDLERSHKK